MANIHTIHDYADAGSSSTTTVTKTKLNDEKLPVECVDKVSHTFQGIDISETSHRKMPCETSNEKEASETEEGISLSCLNEDHLSKLSSWVDKRRANGIPRWKFILDKFITDKDENEILTVSLSQADIGGGNPGFAFLNQLITMNESLTKEKFCKVAKECKRFDFTSLSFMKNLTELMSELELQNKLILAARLNQQGVENDWKHFADKFGLTNEEKDTIGLTINVPNVYSPTRRLIEILIEKEKNTTDLKSVCEDLVFKHTIKIITDIEKLISPP